MAVEVSDEQLRRRVRRIAVVGTLLGFLVGVSFAVLVILVFPDSARQFSGTRFYVGDAVVVVGGLAAIAGAMRFLRATRRQPPAVGSTYAERLRAAHMIRSGEVPQGDDVALARVLCQRALRVGWARVMAMAPVPVMLIGVAIMFRGQTLDIVFVVYAVIGWTALLPTLLVMRRANRFLEATGGR